MLMNSYRTIVVGTDGSELATPTVTRASWLAIHEGAELILVCAYNPLSTGAVARTRTTLSLPRQAGPEVHGHAEARDALATAGAHALELGATVAQSLLVEADPADALLTTCTQNDADLLVVGATRDTSLTGRLLGTVAEEVVRKAPCEVLVVRPRRTP